MPILGPTDFPAEFGGIGTGGVSQEFIADYVAPPAKVDRTTGVVSVRPRSAWARRVARNVAPGDHPPAYNPSCTTVEYVTERLAIAVAASEEVDMNADWDFSKVSTALAKELVLVEREVAVAELVFDTSVWTTTTTLSGGNQWGEGTSDPIGDLRTGIKTVQKQIGRKPNVVIVGAEPAETLLVHEHIEPILRASATARPEEVLANFFDVDVFKLARGTIAEDEVAETSTTWSYIWGKHCLIMCSNLETVTPETVAPSACYTPRVGGQIVERVYIDKKTNTIMTEATAQDCPIVVDSMAAYMVESCVA